LIFDIFITHLARLKISNLKYQFSNDK